jgi:WD40 repeat protein
VLVFDLSQSVAGVLQSISVHASVRSLGFNPSDTLLAAGFENGTIGLWSVPDGGVITPALKVHEQPAGNVIFSSDGSRLFSNAVVGDGKESVVTVSPVPSLQPSTPLVAGASGSQPAMIEVEDHIFASIDNDGRISFWDTDKLAPLGSLKVSGFPLNAAAFDIDNRQLLVADVDGWIRSLDVGGPQWQAQACTLANRPFSSAEWISFLGDQPYQTVCGGKQRSIVRKPLIDLWQSFR